MSNEPSVTSSSTNGGVETETAESLEQSGRRYTKTWIGQRLQRIGIGVGFVIFAVFALFVEKSCTDTFAHHKTHDLGDAVITAPHTLMGFLAVGAVIIAFLIGMGMTIAQIGKLLVGPPKAGRTAEKTVRQFYSNALVHAGTINSSVNLASFVYLLDRAKHELGEWIGFRDYWKGINAKIVELLHVRSQHPVTKTRFEVKSVSILNGTEDRASYVVGIAFSVISGMDNPPFESSKTFGPYLYAANGDTVRIGKRWYLCSGKWNGRGCP